MLTIWERGEDEGPLQGILQTGIDAQAGAGQTHKEANAREKRRHSSTLIPYSYYQSRIPEFFPFVPLHWHEEWELNYILEGKGTVRIGDSEVTVTQGDILLIRPQELHAIESKQRLCYDTVVFSTEMFGSNEDRCYLEMIYPLCRGKAGILPVTEDCAEYMQIRESVETIIRCAKENSAGTDLLMKSELLRFLWHAGNSGVISYHRGAASSKEIRSILDYMAENYAEPLTIRQLAEQVHLSESYFMQRFKEASGMGALEYLNRLRIQKVCTLLLDGEGITDAAYRCGFRNLSNFNRQFKSLTGCTPGQYRRKNV